MGQFDFTYELPTNFSSIVIQLLRQKQHNDMAHAFQQCKFEYDDKGLAYYAGMRGDNWDKRALDFTFEGSEKNIELLTKENAILKELIGRALKPSSSGFLVRNVDFLQVENSFDVELPKEQGENFEVLSTDIHDALSKDEPSLVLDRLHTYSSKYLREICAKHSIPVKNVDGNHYPLHSLAGSLAKYYSNNHLFQSDFAEQALKMSISTFEKYNAIRNTQSYVELLYYECDSHINYQHSLAGYKSRRHVRPDSAWYLERCRLEHGCVFGRIAKCSARAV